MKKRSSISCLLAVVFLLSNAAAQDKRLTFKDALSWKTPGSLEISADGQYIAFTLRETDWNRSKYVSHVWLTDLSTGKTRQFTNGTAGESSPVFSPDGMLLAFVSSRSDPLKGGSDDTPAKRQIWLIPVHGGEAYTLTAAPEGVRNYAWRHDGSVIFFTTRESPDKGVKARNDKLKKQKFDAVVKDKERYRNEIWQIDIHTKKAKRLYGGDYGLGSIAPSPDGAHIAYTTNLTGIPDDGDKTDIWLLDVASGTSRRLTSRQGSESSPQWSPDGGRILFSAPLATTKVPSQSELFIIPSSGGTPVNVTKDFDRSVGGAQFTPGGKDALVTVSDGFYTHLYRLNIDKKSMTPLVKAPVNIRSFCIAKRAGTVASIQSSGSTLPDIFVMDINGEHARKITDVNPQLKNFQLAPQEVIHWKSADGMPVEGLLVKPLGYTPGERVPLIVSVHGGPHGRSTDGLTGGINHQVLAAQGYAVLMTNFRGSSGYNAQFDGANFKDLGGGDYRDIMSGVDKVIAMGIADPARMGVMGGSYGGYMTDWIITQTDRFAAAVSMYGIFSLITDFSNSNIPTWELRYLDDYYWDNFDIYLQHSPMYYVKNVRTPTLIMHGQADPNTFIANSNEMYQALKKMNAVVEYVTFPREGHGIGGEPNHALDKCRRAAGWFEKYVLRKPDTLPAGTPVVKDQWEMTVRSAAAQVKNDTDGNQYKEVTVALDMRFSGDSEPDLSINLQQECSLILSGGREVSAVGFISDTGGGNTLIKTGSIAIARARTVSLNLVFNAPADETKAKFKLKQFPLIAVAF